VIISPVKFDNIFWPNKFFNFFKPGVQINGTLYFAQQFFIYFKTELKSNKNSAQ
jgi:hypothetical protein